MESRIRICLPQPRITMYTTYMQPRRDTQTTSVYLAQRQIGCRCCMYCQRRNNLTIKSWHQDLGLSHPASQWLSNCLSTEFSEIIMGRYIFLSAFLLPLLINHSLFPKSTWPSSCSFCKMNVLNRFHNFLYNLLFIFY